jgi:hypothetical protein
MSKVKVTQTPLDILRNLLVEDRWRACAHLDPFDDFFVAEDMVNPIEALAKSMSAAKVETFPDIFPKEPVEPDFLLRDGSDLALRIDTGDVPITVSLPGFIKEILGMTEDEEKFYRIPSDVIEYCTGLLISPHVEDVNLRPTTDPPQGRVLISWDEYDSPETGSTVSLLITVRFEGEGVELFVDAVIGDMLSTTIEVDWNHIEVHVRLIPRVEAKRIFWFPNIEVELLLSPPETLLDLPLLPVKGKITREARKNISKLLTPFLEEWGSLIASGILALPLRPIQKQYGEVNFEALNLLQLGTLISGKGQNLPWENFIRDWINSSLLPNNLLRSVGLSGNLMLHPVVEFYPARLMDHYVQHGATPRHESKASIFDVSPIQPLGKPYLNYYDKDYQEKYIVQREKYQIILDSIHLEQQTFNYVIGLAKSDVRWTVNWNIQVYHPHLDKPGLDKSAWVKLRSKTANIFSSSPILQIGDAGVSIDWLEWVERFSLVEAS